MAHPKLRGDHAKLTFLTTRKGSLRIICVSGPDGVGKTTHCKKIQSFFKQNGIQTDTVWLRQPRLLSYVIVFLSTLLGSTRIQFKNGSLQAEHRFSRYKVIATLWICTQVIDAMVMSLLSVFLPKARGKLIILDRWIPDILVDLSISTGKSRLIGSYPSNLLMRLTSDCKVIILDASLQALLSRNKDELKPSQLAKTKHFYKMLATRYGLPIVDTESPFSNVHELITLQHLSGIYQKRERTIHQERQ